MKLKLPQQAEWDFESVPDEELHACLLHEYLRELGSVAIDHPSYRALRDEPEMELIRDLLGDPSVTNPWLTLSEQQRRALSRYYGHMARTGTKDVLFGMVMFTPEKIGPLAPPERAPSSTVSVWWEYTDAEILDALKEWLRTNRPKSTRATRKGKSFNDLRVKLERLGIMRLLNAAPLKTLQSAETQRLFPQAAKLVERRGAEAYRDRKQAIEDIREVFPDIVEVLDLTPRSAPTAGGRSK